jgi:hypothetical protein
MIRKYGKVAVMVLITTVMLLAVALCVIGFFQIYENKEMLFDGKSAGLLFAIIISAGYALKKLTEQHGDALFEKEANRSQPETTEDLDAIQENERLKGVIYRLRNALYDENTKRMKLATFSRELYSIKLGVVFACVFGIGFSILTALSPWTQYLQTMLSKEEYGSFIYHLARFRHTICSALWAMIVSYFIYAMFSRRTKSDNWKHFWNICLFPVIGISVLGFMVTPPNIWESVFVTNSEAALESVPFFSGMPRYAFVLMTRFAIYPLSSMIGGLLARYVYGNEYLTTN